LTYHRVARAPDPLRARMLAAGEFRGQMRMLSRFFRPVALAEGLRTLRAGTLPPRSVAVTFDDGYADNVQVALPILLAEGVPATFFISTSYLDGGRMWNDTVIESVRRLPAGRHRFSHAGFGQIDVPDAGLRRPLTLKLLEALKYLPQHDREAAADALAALADGALPSDLMMRRDDVRALIEAGMEVGGHTRTHPILSALSARQAEQEILGGLEDLAALTGQRPELFAYPNGRHGHDYGDREVSILRHAGVVAALVTNRGVVRAGSDPLQLPRLAPWHKSAARFGFALWRAYSEPDWHPGRAATPEAGYTD
jgi:peptidoglycan/xylan/chitin deacetylase (PgdA/CDA1 family)